MIEVSEGDLLDISVEKTIAFLEGMKLILIMEVVEVEDEDGIGFLAESVIID